jgi:hypothetical protein
MSICIRDTFLEITDEYYTLSTVVLNNTATPTYNDYIFERNHFINAQLTKPNL